MAKVLLVEDDVDLQNLYREKLEHEGFQVFGASSGAQALTILNDKKPNVVMLDIMLPGGLNGFDVLEQIRSNDDYKKVPVLVITSLDNQKEIALSVGANDIVVKSSVTPEDVIVRLKSLLKGK
jgi:two-component system OmpR family response regulator/two-component system alkaline phosphatase synthesis response regulator PhoP